MTDHDILKQYMLPDRERRMDDVLRARTSDIVVVLENLHKEHNIEAVLRTCEALGLQHVHIVPQPGRERISKDITQGCERWLTIHYHVTVGDCFMHLKDKGFRVLAGSLNEGSTPLVDMDLSGRVALVFSNELEGASDQVTENADGFFVVPLCGFTRSLNVSVAAGIVIHHTRIWKEMIDGSLAGLPKDESKMIHAKWMKMSVRRSEDILTELEKRK